jgi:biotin carboxyl carrier protein
MFKAKVGSEEFEVLFSEEKANVVSIGGRDLHWQIHNLEHGKFSHVLLNSQSHLVEVVLIDREKKQLLLKVNNREFEIVLQDKFDLLLAKMGLSSTANVKVANLKAPMPGLVIGIRVEQGQAVSKGDPLLVLEAMKMENIIKSPVDGVIRKISCEKGIAVEKGAILLHFE